jgi:hypothetical protein
MEKVCFSETGICLQVHTALLHIDIFTAVRTSNLTLRFALPEMFRVSVFLVSPLMFLIQSSYEAKDHGNILDTENLCVVVVTSHRCIPGSNLGLDIGCYD